MWKALETSARSAALGVWFLAIEDEALALRA
jgi:hypothetical protein